MDDIQTCALLKYLVKHKLINDHQFGFMPNKSTTQQLVYLTDTWTRALDAGKSVIATFLDFEKAFDKVWHSGLLHKLGLSGLLPSALGWLESYLYDRKIVVVVESVCSNSYQINSGVPQGSLSSWSSGVCRLHK